MPRLRNRVRKGGVNEPIGDSDARDANRSHFRETLSDFSAKPRSPREKQMEWFTTNWFWIVVGIAFVVMHLFGHGGHGGHSGHGGQPPTDEARKSDAEETRASTSSGGHHH